MKMIRQLVAISIVAMMVLSLAACGKPAPAPSPSATPGEAPETTAPGPVKITFFLSDNATLPFTNKWLAVQEATKRFNVDAKFEPIPMGEYNTKVSLALNTGENLPDVILYQDTTGENTGLALNGALVPISDYADWTPNFNNLVKRFGLEKDVAELHLKDGKRYYLPALHDNPVYDAGLILREDFLKKKGFDAPKTFDDLYKILKAYKVENPKSYPLTLMYGPRVMFRMTQESFGINVGMDGTAGQVLSYDRKTGKFFEGAISDQAKTYLSYLAKLYKEGLFDPEMTEPIDGDKWSQKMATGKSIATYAYYDQIGGVEGNSTIPGFKLNMYPPLAGPVAAYHQPKNRTSLGIMFPTKTAARKDFEQIVRAVDNMFYSDEGSKIWNIGVEGVTYKMEGGKIVYNDEILKDPAGIFKAMQLKYGCGNDVTQMVWINEREMTKYDENFAAINKAVAAMKGIPQLPPKPTFDDLATEEATSLQSPLFDTFTVWANDFITNKKDINKHWDAYVREMKQKGIEKLCQMYNDHSK